MAHSTHVGEVMSGISSPEFVGWIEYFRIKDEIQRHQLVWAICRAFNGDKADKNAKSKPAEDEEVIDTTDPSFAENFKGFINEPAKGQTPGMNIAQAQAQQRAMGTQILMG